MAKQADGPELRLGAENAATPLPPAVRYLVWGLIALGVALRFRQYLFNAALWLDEASLTVDLLHGQHNGLLAHAGHTQVAPLGFLVLTRLSVRLFGDGEHALRLLPLASSLAAFVPLYLLARRWLSAWAVPIAVGLLAVCPAAVRYSAIVKPYSTDLLVSAILAYVGALTFARRLDLKWGLLLALTGAAAVWFSFPAIFVLAGFGAALGLSALLRRQWGRALRLSIVGLVWASSLGACCVLALGPLISSGGLHDYWRSDFMPLPPATAADLRWFVEKAAEVFRDPGGLPLAGLAAFAFGAGILSLTGRDRALALALVAPIGVALLASGFRLYAFSGRLLLFSLPLLYLVIAEGAECVRACARGRLRFAGPLFLVLLLGPPCAGALRNAVAPESREEIRPVLAYVAQHRQEGDKLYAYQPAQWAYAYYAPRYGLGQVRVLRVEWLASDRTMAHGMERLRGGGRTWVIFTHISPADEKAFLAALDGMGSRLSQVHAPGANGYLYDLRGGVPAAVPQR